jgi:preprotein translocase subunit SecG
MRAVLMVIQVFASLAIIGLVLIQRGKGADAGAGFGSGASGTVFGARGATTTLSRATAIFAAVFMLCSLALAYMGTRQAEAPKTLLDQVAAQQQIAPLTSKPILPAATAPASPAASGSSAAGAVAPAASPAAAPAVPANAPQK